MVNRDTIIEPLLKEGIFVVHALNGYEYHEARIIKLFKKTGLQFEFITQGDPNHFSKEEIDKYFVSDISRILPDGILSCTLNHIYAYEQMVSRGLEYAIIFENDPFFLGSFVNKLRRYAEEIENLPKGFIISLENTTLKFPSFWKTKRGKHLYQAKSGRMAGAYLIDLKGARNILDDLKSNKCHTVIDWWHNSLIDRGVFKMYWAHPPLTEQGSHNGSLNATISRKPNTVFRKVSWLSQKYYKYSFPRMFKDKEVL